MSDRDRETWERFAAAVVCGIYADPTAGALRDEWLVKEADRFLAITKERWPEKTCSPGCETVTPATAGDETVAAEPDPGEGYRWVRPGEIRNVGDEFRSDAGSWEVVWHFHHQGGTVHERYRYRRRIDAAPQPSSGACQSPAETTPRADEVRSEVRIAEGDGVEELETAAWGVMRVGGSWVSLHGTESAAYLSKARVDVAENWLHVVVPLVSRADAERLIAAARREAEEARAECERLRITDEERRLLSKYHRSEERAIEQFAVTSASYVADAKHATAVIGGLLARHDKGGAT
jgi:hypothetical protein